MALKTGRLGLYVPKFPPRKARKIAGSGKLKGVGRVKTKSAPKAEVVSTGMYKQTKYP